MIALFGNLSLLEVVAIAALSIMVFGRDLPRVAAQVVTHVQRARRALQKVWRESGIGDEIRQVQREIEQGSSKLRKLSPHELARNAMRDIDAQVRKPMEGDGARDDDGSRGDPEPGQPDSAKSEQAADEPAAERSRRPPWYPETVDPLQAMSNPTETGQGDAHEEAPDGSGPADPSPPEEGDGELAGERREG